MTRYKALRVIGCDFISASFIALVNWLRDVPDGEIRFLTVVMEYET